MYINEIIRINYKCNWKCSFCNVLKVNNYWEKDVSKKQIILEILSLSKKYSIKQRSELLLSFSWWEPTINKNLINYIKLAKKIWIWKIQIQTNWSLLFKNNNLLDSYLEGGLNEIFLAQHSHIDKINEELWCLYNFKDFVDWFEILKNKKVKVNIILNIVITKVNLNKLLEFIKKLIEIWFIDYIWNRISFWFCQPNWYAWLNKGDLLLKFDEKENKIINDVIYFCKWKNIIFDFHYTTPPLCILNYKEYNLAYKKIKELEEDKESWNINVWNLESFKFLRKEKQKFKLCEKCINNNYCLWFYKNWVSFVWEEYVREKIKKYIIWK
jgi:MoaA/NifB/PqqE/SkfB family radical SAM enzyme